VKYILVLLWTLVLLSIGWAVSIILVTRYRSCHGGGYIGPYSNSSCWDFGFNWNIDEYSISQNSVPLYMTPAGNIQTPGTSPANFTFAGQIILGLLFTCLIQGSQTIALHCVELLVNITQEKLWRRAYIATTHNNENERRSSSGACIAMNPLFSAISSWEYLILFILKSLLHWVMRQSLLAIMASGYGDLDAITFAFQFEMIYSRLIIYAVLACVLAGFAAYLAFRHHAGCQPATMGHIQTIANLIDEWDLDKAGDYGGAISRFSYV
jgi:hypothetical protein